MLGRFKKRDIEGGQFTFGERIMLGRIFREEEVPDIERTKQIIEVLHDKRVNTLQAIRLMPYALEVAKAFVAWIEREERECSVPPLEEAKQAGIETLAKNCGDMASVVDFAERFGWSFEQVYKMPYMDAFTLWKIDAERGKYQRRLQNVLKRKKGK